MYTKEGLMVVVGVEIVEKRGMKGRKAQATLEGSFVKVQSKLKELGAKEKLQLNIGAIGSLEMS
jgi:hypothetical protein